MKKRERERGGVGMDSMGMGGSGDVKSYSRSSIVCFFSPTLGVSCCGVADLLLVSPSCVVIMRIGLCLPSCCTKSMLAQNKKSKIAPCYFWTRQAVVISSLKIPNTFLLRSGAQQIFSYTFVLIFPTDLPSQIIR